MKTELVFNILQKKTNDTPFCSNAVSECIAYMKNLRNEDKLIDFLNATKRSTSLEPETSMSRTEMMDEYIGNPLTSKYKQVYFEVLDNVITQLETRFSHCDKLLFLKLGDTNQFGSYAQHFPVEGVDSLLQTYGAFFSRSQLRVELETVYSSLHKQT